MGLAAPRPKVAPDSGVLFARKVKQVNLNWLKKDCKKKNLSMGEYLDQVLDQLRKTPSKKVGSKGRKSAARKK